MVHMNDELGDFQRTITESRQHVDDMREQEYIEAIRCNVVLYTASNGSMPPIILVLSLAYSLLCDNAGEPCMKHVTLHLAVC